MSWPTDGEPRFVVREHTGIRIGAHGSRTGSKSRAGLSVRVVDRGYAWRTLVEWASEDVRSPRGPAARRELLRQRAAQHAARLNARVA